jgi:hypothetical protein
MFESELGVLARDRQRTKQDAVSIDHIDVAFVVLAVPAERDGPPVAGTFG